MNEATREKLMGVSVATLATALFKRGLRNQVIQGVHPLGRKGRNMVGPAFTLRYMPAREDRNQLSEFLKPDHPQRVAIETCPEGHVLVMDSRKDARAASANAPACCAARRWNASPERVLPSGRIRKSDARPSSGAIRRS